MLKKVRQFLYGRFIGRLTAKKAVVLYYNGPQYSDFIRLVDTIKAEKEFLLGYHEAYVIYCAIQALGKISGELAEVGVYQGGSAKMMAEIKGDRELYLFDTFEGLPYEDLKTDMPGFVKGQYPANFEDVKKYLSSYHKVYLYKGVFPHTAGPVGNKKFAFVHLDVDIYQSTLEALGFFYPRMSGGGVYCFP